MNDQELYHARQRANNAENELRALQARLCKHRWTTSRTSKGTVTVCKDCGTTRPTP